MASDEIHELAVKLIPEGVDETENALDSVSDTFEDTADTAGEESKRLDSFADKWSGAMTAIVVGLGVAVAGLASKIPVVGELMAGLEAIIDAVAFRLDERLRPVLAPVADALFDVADAIFDTDGAAGVLLDTVLLLGAGIAGLVVAVFAAGSALAKLGFGAGGAAAVASVFGTLAGWISTAASAIAGFIAGSIAAAAAVGALIGTLAVAILEVTGIMDIVRDFGTTLGNQLPEWASQGIIALIGFFVGGLAILGAAIAGFVSGVLEGGLQEGIDRAISNAVKVGEFFVDSWLFFLEKLAAGAVAHINNAIQGIEGLMSAASDAAAELPGVSVGGVSLGRVGGIQGPSGSAPTSPGVTGSRTASGGSQFKRLIQAMQNTDLEAVFQIDSKEVASETMSFLGGEAETTGRGRQR